MNDLTLVTVIDGGENLLDHISSVLLRKKLLFLNAVKKLSAGAKSKSTIERVISVAYSVTRK